MTKMTATLIYGKNPLIIIFSRTRERVTLDLVCGIWDVEATKFIQIMILC